MTLKIHLSSCYSLKVFNFVPPYATNLYDVKRERKWQRYLKTFADVRCLLVCSAKELDIFLTPTMLLFATASNVTLQLSSK